MIQFWSDRALMPDKTFLNWPFFEERHRALAAGIESWCAANLPSANASASDDTHANLDAACRDLVRRFGRDGWLAYTAPDPAAPEPLDVRALCLIRETLARHDALADFAFAMQGLGAGPISLFGNVEQRRWLARTRNGEAIVAFALTEQQSGSDVANIGMSARRDGDSYVLDGEKTWISNGGLADLYGVFARTGEAPGAKGISAFIVPGDATGLSVAERLDVISPHPLARIAFDGVRVPASSLIGAPGDGFKIAMATLDVFRATVAAAALGFARRALDETLKRVRDRRMFDGALADLQLVQGAIAEMALDIDAAALLVYRAAWTKDLGAARVTREASMAKLFATERAQRVVDKAVQLHGGDGVRRGHKGASEVQKVIIARQLLAGG
jgi:acyl-CoA dehydrogenase